MKKDYYLGLDIGTNSVGFAATDDRYRLIKYKGEAVWGSHLFDEASQSAERRSFRTARRRLDRRQQRIRLVDEIFAPEVAKVDPYFYIRKQESALWAEDKNPLIQDSTYLFAKGSGYSDKQYHKDYPTIHHLLCDIMHNPEKKFDIRLLNLAVDWLVAHRGHFLSEIGSENIDRVLDFKSIYDEFISYFDINGIESPWDQADPMKIGEILKLRGVNQKKQKLTELLFSGKITASDEYPFDKKELIAFLAGGKVKVSKLFRYFEPEEDISIAISDDMETVLPQIGDYADIVAKMAAMYDWSVLSDIKGDSTYISEAKVRQYDIHKKDLSGLKAFVRKYAKDKYYRVFRASSEKLKNYTAYSYNLRSVKGEDYPKGKASAEDFYAFLKKELSLDKIEVEEDDRAFYEDMMVRMSEGSFLPKQVDSDNRVIPYQLYLAELKKILENAGTHYKFINEKDDDGYINKEKLEQIFRFKIPYFVGPLRTDNTKYGWMKRKADGEIRPWNFHDLVDLDASEDAFINRMTNTCTYIPGEKVLPKWSVLYSRFTVLNEINNITMNSTPLDVETKQEIYNELFCKKAKVSVKNITEYLIATGKMKPEDTLGGLDITVKSSLKPLYEFRHMLNSKALNLSDVDSIVERCTYTEDKTRYRSWLKRKYPALNQDDLKYLGRLNYKDFGRLSGFFLKGMEGTNKETGETGTIIHFLWETNDNLMQLLSDRYTFVEEITKLHKAYYAEHPLTLNEQMEDMGISNAVKRPVIRTLAVVDDIVSSLGCAPKKIFVEMARGSEEKKRTVTRKEQILDLYKKIKDEDISELEKQLEAMGDTANNKLQSEALFLYYMQLGKCMYSGQPISLSELKTTKYNVDHIYPQSMVKDDSILNNKVLVLSEINGEKSDVYPISSEIRQKMRSFWTMLEHNGLITKEKYSRLIRNTAFSESEKMGFINRQLVETRQSMKAVTQLIGNIYPETEIVYVKAMLAADFKREFELPVKSRIINDLHHAKDAYLNVVVGNVYNERFTKKYFNINDKYTLNLKKLFERGVSHNDRVIWDMNTDMPTVRKMYGKNHAHLTRYAYCQRGGLYDQMPVKKGDGQAQIKKGLDIEKYAGYNKKTASFFSVVSYLRGTNKEISFVPVDLMASDRFLNDEEFAVQYIRETLQGINKKRISDISFPIGRRPVKIKSTISLDGYRVWVNGKANNGGRVMLSSAESALYSDQDTAYIKRIENYVAKRKENKNIQHDSDFDGLSESENCRLYEVLTNKLGNRLFINMPGNPYEVIHNGKDIFEKLDFNSQIPVLVSIIDLLKSGRAGGRDLYDIGGAASSGSIYISAALSSSQYSQIKIIDESPAGLHTKESPNLKDFLL